MKLEPLAGHHNGDRLPQPSVDKLEGLPVVQASFCGQNNIDKGGRGEGGDYQCIIFHGRNSNSIKKCLNSFDHDFKCMDLVYRSSKTRKHCCGKIMQNHVSTTKFPR